MHVLQYSLVYYVVFDQSAVPEMSLAEKNVFGGNSLFFLRLLILYCKPINILCILSFTQLTEFISADKFIAVRRTVRPRITAVTI